LALLNLVAVIEFMTQPAVELLNLSRILLALKGGAQAFQPMIALSFPARRFSVISRLAASCKVIWPF